MPEMKTLNGYEIVDANARDRLDTLENEQNSQECVPEVYIGEGDMPEGAVLQLVVEDDDTTEDAYRGKSAYEIWLEQGNTGSEADFLESLKGADGMTQVTPLYAESVEWLEANGEQDKLYVLPDGYIYAYMYTEVEVGGYVNMVDQSSDEWKDGHRLTYNGTITTASSSDSANGAFVSNLIPCKKGDILRVRGVTNPSGESSTAAWFVVIFLESDGTTNAMGTAGNVIYLKTIPTSISPETFMGNVENIANPDGDDLYVYPILTMKNGSQHVNADNVAFCRVSGIPIDGVDNVVVTVNEEIIEAEVIKEYKWTNTGHAFVPADYEGRIVGLEAEMASAKQDIKDIKEDIKDIKENGVASKGASFDYTEYGLPILYLAGDISAMTKDTSVTLDYVYGDRYGTCTVKWQGSSSLTYPKKNYTVKFDTEFEAAPGWGLQKKYCMKANFMDFSHSRNIVSAKLWGQVVKSRPSTNALYSTLSALPNGGAIDGFPIVIVINDDYQGIYTFNIPKDGWMMGMGNGTQEAIICADGYSTANQATLFLNEALCDGTDFEIEYVPDENDTAWVATSLNRMINAVLASDGGDIDTTIAQYMDIDSAIDYMLFTMLVHGADMVKKNYLLATFDGVKWFFSAYDMDSTYGITWDGGYYKSENYSFKAAVGASGEYPVLSSMKSNALFMLLCKHKASAVKERYAELRSGVMSEANIAHEFNEFAALIAKPYFGEEPMVWPTIPATSVNNASQIVTHYMLRTTKVDDDVNGLT